MNIFSKEMLSWIYSFLLKLLISRCRQSRVEGKDPKDYGEGRRPKEDHHNLSLNAKDEINMMQVLKFYISVKTFWVLQFFLKDFLD